jgi:hypothetical protein
MSKRSNKKYAAYIPTKYAAYIPTNGKYEDLIKLNYDEKKVKIKDII